MHKLPAPKPKARYRVTNWREYNRALVARGAITLNRAGFPGGSNV